ncbi:MAG: cupin domain-containing protein [Spirochaetota bacterium]|nr:cupin domain-containing protein [Spirochaetota bacterium]
MKDAAYWIEKLNLRKHPEGGYYRETYRSDELIDKRALPERFLGERSLSTAIYFLLSDNEFSAFHRLKSDELWHYYTGSSITIHTIDENGIYSCIKLGNDFENNEVFQATVRAGDWMGASLNHPPSFSLVGCTVSPGFDFNDFEMGSRTGLIKLFPQHRLLIEQLTLT